MGFFGRSNKSSRTRKLSAADRFLPRIENLESRLIPYNTSGNAWPTTGLVTLSFVPDGTDLGGVTSNLFSNFNQRFGSPSVWQAQILKAAQVWAKNSDLNFAIVSDNGAPLGSGLYQQGDPGFGDIRIGGYDFGTSTLAMAYSPAPINNYSIAGDIQINTGQTFNIGTTYDLFTVAAHEFGHATGMNHSSVIYASEYSTYTGVKTGIDYDDIYGIRQVYNEGNPRSADWNDAYGGGNESFAAAVDITQHIQSDLTVLRLDRDITTTSDLDFFKITVPSGVGSTVQISAQSGGLSLLAPKITVYASDQTTVLGSANGLNQYGVTQTVTLNSQVSAGQVIYIKVQGADTTPFGTGKYALGMKFGAATPPTQAPLVTQLANGTPLSGGGGTANAASQELRIDPPSGLSFQTSTESRQTVAIDGRGNYVVTWASFRAATGGWEIYAQMFGADDSPHGDPFVVNTSNAGQHKYPAVAMSYDGDFLITWAATEADGSGWGILARAFDAETGTWSSEFRVNQFSSDDQSFPAAAIDANGNSVITWSSDKQDGSGWGVYARRFDITGNALGNEFRANVRVSKDQLHSSVAMDALGNFVIVWSSKDQDTSGWGVIGRRFDSAGNALGNDFIVNTYKTGDQRYSSIAMDREGRFVVVWASDGQDGSGWGVYGQMFGADGSKAQSEFRVNTTTANDQSYPSVSMSWEGDFLVTWSSNGGGGGLKPITLPGGINAGNQYSMQYSGSSGSGGSSSESGSISSSASDGLLTFATEMIVEQVSSGTRPWGVYAQQYHHMHTQGEEFRVNTSEDGDQRNGSVAMNGMGKVIVSWNISSILESIGVQPYTIGSDEMHGFEDRRDPMNGCGWSACVSSRISQLGTSPAEASYGWVGALDAVTPRFQQFDPRLDAEPDGREKIEITDHRNSSYKGESHPLVTENFGEIGTDGAELRLLQMDALQYAETGTTATEAHTDSNVVTGNHALGSDTTGISVRVAHSPEKVIENPGVGKEKNPWSALALATFVAPLWHFQRKEKEDQRTTGRRVSRQVEK